MDAGTTVDTTVDRVRAILTELTPLDLAVADPSLRLVEDLGFDSLGLVELAAALEDEFALEPIPEEETINITTVAHVERLVAEQLTRAERRLDTPR